MPASGRTSLFLSRRHISLLSRPLTKVCELLVAAPFRPSFRPPVNGLRQTPPTKNVAHRTQTWNRYTRGRWTASVDVKMEKYSLQQCTSGGLGLLLLNTLSMLP